MERFNWDILRDSELGNPLNEQLDNNRLEEQSEFVKALYFKMCDLENQLVVLRYYVREYCQKK